MERPSQDPSPRNHVANPDGHVSFVGGNPPFRRGKPTGKPKPVCRGPIKQTHPRTEIRFERAQPACKDVQATHRQTGWVNLFVTNPKKTLPTQGFRKLPGGRG